MAKQSITRTNGEVEGRYDRTSTGWALSAWRLGASGSWHRTRSSRTAARVGLAPFIRENEEVEVDTLNPADVLAELREAAREVCLAADEAPAVLHIPVTEDRDYSLTTNHVLVQPSGKRFGIGAVARGRSGRKVFQGELVPGPWAYTFGLATCIAANPRFGTAAEIERNRAAGIEHDVVDGQELVFDNVRYRVEFVGSFGQKRGNLEFIELVKVEELQPEAHDPHCSCNDCVVDLEAKQAEALARPEKVYCDCEHSSHFDGGLGHAYGTHTATWEHRTSWGTFHLCESCHDKGHACDPDGGLHQTIVKPLVGPAEAEALAEEGAAVLDETKVDPEATLQLGAVVSALKVFVLDPVTSDWLAANDPQGLIQARRALGLEPVHVPVCACCQCRTGRRGFRPIDGAFDRA